MVDLPKDLTVLPTMPYSQRPDDLPLDVEECRTALWLHHGNITEAAATLKVSPQRFRKFVNSNPYLIAEQQESLEQIKDKAVSVIREGLNDADERYTMARYVMSGIGKDRGFGANASGPKVTVNGGVTIIQWADGSSVTEPTTIEGEVVNG